MSILLIKKLTSKRSNNKSGKLYTFGGNHFGQLGIGNSYNIRSTPTLVKTKDKINSVSCGYNFTGIVDDNGKLWTFGNNDNLQLGLGSNIRRDIPVHVKDSVETSKHESSPIPKVKMISCGHDHSAFIDVNENLWVSGNNDYGQLGLRTDEIAEVSKPIMNKDVGKIKMVSCGDNFTAIINMKGELYTFGFQGDFFDLGLMDKRKLYIPTKIKTTGKVKMVSCGYDHVAFITKKGELYTFGINRWEQLGRGNQENSKIPVRIPIKEKVNMISCGTEFTSVIDKKGNLYTFGKNDSGQLGIGKTTDFVLIPTKIKDVENRKFLVKYVACGENFVAVINKKGELYTFGNNMFGQLGIGNDKYNFSSPVKVEIHGRGRMVSCGFNHVAIII